MRRFVRKQDDSLFNMMAKVKLTTYTKMIVPDEELGGTETCAALGNLKITLSLMWLGMMKL